MLSKSSIVPALPVESLARARQFYEDKLGLKPLEIRLSGVLYECGNDTSLIIYEAKAAKSEHIAAIFEVQNLQREVTTLEKKGIVFGEYDLQDSSTVDKLTSLSAGNVACFQDSEGNILALVQIGMLLEIKERLTPFQK